MIDKIGHYSLENTASIYDEEAMTALELAGRTATKVNECVDEINTAIDRIPATVDNAVQAHINSGEFDAQIGARQEDILNEVEENRLAMQSQLINKVDKGSVGSVTMNMLSQDVKTAMTGGSVPVVGANSVGATNIIDESITPQKLEPILLDVHSYSPNYDVPFLMVDHTNKTVTVNRDAGYVNIVTRYGYHRVEAADVNVDYSLYTSWSGIFLLWYEPETNTIHVTKVLNFYYDWLLIGYFYGGSNYKTTICVDCDGGLYTVNKDLERCPSLLLLRPFYTDGTKIVPYIDYDNKELVIPKHVICYGMNSNRFDKLLSADEGDIHVPFTDGTTTQYLVGSPGKLEFIKATNYTSKTKINQYYVFGFIDTTLKHHSLSFECEVRRSLSILGDSISTFPGYNPEANAVYYDGSSGGVNHVYQTWWHRVMNRCGLALNTNNSWSGAKVSGNEASSAVSRATNLDNGTDPDIIILYMGANDFNHNVPIGAYDCKTKPVKRDTFKEAYALTLQTILTRYKNSKVFVMTLPASYRGVGERYAPAVNGAGTALWEYNQAIKDVANAYHIEVIDTATCQINAFNGNVNFHDFDTETGTFLHPNNVGFKKIADKVIKAVLHSAE